jgi:lactoylglutathione lyase
MSSMQEKNSEKISTGHIGLNVSNLSVSIKFYQEVFNLQVMAESEAESRRYAFLGDGERLILTLWQQSVGRFDPHRPGLHHLSFQVPTIADVEQVEARLRSRNIKLIYEGVVPHSEGATSGGIFFEDPDGIRLEIYTTTGVTQTTAPVAGAPSCGFF